MKHKNGIIDVNWGGCGFPTYEGYLNSAPVFGTEDHVEVPDFTGKSPAEIAKYYQDREKRVLDEANRRINAAREEATPPPPPAPPQRVQITKEQFYENPTEGVEAVVKDRAVSKDDFNRLAGPAQKNMIATAKMVASQGKEHWQRFLPAIESIMARMDGYSQIDPDNWEAAYFNVVGFNESKLRAEAVTKATTKAAEPPQSASEIAAPPTDLNTISARGKTAADVCEGLNITHDQYREADKMIQTGKWPMTMNNTRRKS